MDPLLDIRDLVTEFRKGYRCLGTQIGDVAVIGGLVGLSNEHAAEAHKM